MRGIVAGLLIAMLLMVVSVAAAALGTLGVVAIGWVLHQWFDVTVFQGALLALGVMGILSFLLYRLAAVPSTPSVVFGGDPESTLGADALDEDGEPRIVAWRRSRNVDRPGGRRTGAQ